MGAEWVGAHVVLSANLNLSRSKVFWTVQILERERGWEKFGPSKTLLDGSNAKRVPPRDTHLSGTQVERERERVLCPIEGGMPL